MNTKTLPAGHRVLAFARRRQRLLLGLGAAVAIYALLGFFLAPWLVRNTAIDAVRENLGADLAIEKVAINPFVLSLRVDGLVLDDPSGDPFLGIEQIFVNFQSSSLFRWALTFDEIRFDEPHLYLDRAASGDLNLAFLAGSGKDQPDRVAEEQEAGLPRLVVFDFAVNRSVVDWHDSLPAEPVVTQFGPVDIGVHDLSTLPSREGAQEVVIATETSGSLSWQGSLQLNPFRSVGTAAVTGSHFPLISRYIRHDTGIDIARGDADLRLDYAVDTLADGSTTASIDNLHIVFADLLVRTFGPAATGGDDANRDLLALPKLEIAGGSFRWPERSVSVGSIALDDSVLSLYRDASGRLDIVRDAPATGGDDAEPAPAAPGGGAPWSLSLDRFELRQAAIGLIDDSVSPGADIGVEQLDFAVNDISNTEGAAFPTTVSMRTRGGGSITASGQVGVLPTPVAEFDFEADGISLALVQSYISSLADVSLDSGALALTGSFRHAADNPLTATSDIAVTDFLITETDEGTRLGSWARLGLTGVKVDLGTGTVDVADIQFDEPYADIFIAADGTVNLGRVEKGTRSAEEQEATEAAEPEAPATEEPASPPFAVSIGAVKIVEGSASFADVSLPLPFEAEIAELNGNLSTIATSSAEPSEVSMEGKVDEFGLVRVSGTVTPLEPPKNTDLNVVFQNVEMPKFSAYTIPFAGREIASGRLDLDLGYQLKDGALVGENNIVLRDFELGDNVPHPGAMSLPLGLAVALLKDGNGTIDIDLPVRGDVNDPEFSYGGVIGKALLNLIVKIVASPFALLGNLLGIEPSELEFITFAPGRADLTPPEQERAARLAEALALRPELVLEIPPVVAPGIDGDALKAAQLDSIIEARIAGSGDATATLTGQQSEVLEQFYRETAATTDPDADLAAWRLQFTVSEAGEQGEVGPPSFDALAYAAELRRQLVELQTLPGDALADLAAARAANTREAIAAIDPALESRVAIIDINNEPDTGEDSVRMQVSLTARE